MKLTPSILALLLVLTGVAPLPAQDAPLPPGIAWQPDWNQALALAKAENRPIMVAFVLKGEKANQEVMERHFKDPEVVQESRRFVCLVACRLAMEATMGVRADGETGPVSVDLGSASPDEIRKVEGIAQATLIKSKNVSCPQFFFLEPDGKTVLLRHVWMLPKAELLKKMRTAHGLFDPDSASADVKASLDQVSKLLEDAQSKDRGTRRSALGTLAALDDPRIAPFLVKRTQENIPSLERLEAIYIMGQRGNAKALSRLEELLQARDVTTRSYALVSMGKVGMEESLDPLLQMWKSERQDRVRTHVLRAIVACGVAVPETVEGVLLNALKGRAWLDQVTALHILNSHPTTPPLTKAILKCVGSGSKDVRTAAYVTIGNIMLTEALSLLKRRLPAEKGEVLAACQWALARLGEGFYEGETDPEEEVANLLPDRVLYEDDLEAILDGGGGGRGGGGRGGGGRGGGRRGR
jgi:HEAT repeat protein